MSYNFIECDRDQTYLMPPSLKDWLAEDHLVWLILDAVGEMNLAGFYEKYRVDGWGRAAYEPSMMVSVLLYAYCVGERSSRRIEKLCAQDVAFRVAAANNLPDHCTIARFRRDSQEELAKLFDQVLRLCAEAGLVRAGVVALDGTKIKASAALDSNRTYRHIKEEVERMLAEAEATDEEEDKLYGKDKRGDELPEELGNRSARLARLRECKDRLEKEAEDEAAVRQHRIDQRQADEDRTGKKKRGRKPKAPDENPDPQAKANTTDPDSRIMKTRKGFVQGYNAQAVATKDQIILAAEVTCEENDVRQLHPMLEATDRNLDLLEGEHRIKTVLADAGYCSEANITLANPDGPEFLIATTKDHKQRRAGDNPPRGRIPKDLGPTERMQRKLQTKKGRALYKKRGETVEPVFGQIKEVRGCDGFMRRGEAAAGSEWKLICLTHNLLKLWRHLTAAIKKRVNRATAAQMKAGITLAA